MARIPFLILFAALISVFSCNNDDDILKGCGFDNPREELPWLKARIDSMAASTDPGMIYCYVVQGTYKNRTVFRFEDCNPIIDKAIFTLNCDGNSIDPNDGSITSGDLKNPTIIWKPVDFACQVDF